jgi:hypothetical protein
MHRIPPSPDIQDGHMTIELRLDRRWLLRSIDLAPDAQISLMERSPYFFLVSHGERVHFAPDQQVHFGAYRLAAKDFGQLPSGPLVVVNRSPDRPARVFLLSDRQAVGAAAVHARAHSLAGTPSQPRSGETTWWPLLLHTDLCRRGWDVGVELHRIVGATRRHGAPTRALAVVLAGRGRFGRAGNDNGGGELSQAVEAGDVVRFGRDVPHVFDGGEGGLCLLSLQAPESSDDLTPGPERGPRTSLTIS